ncbi:MAG TPA: tRNA (adenine(22)-N(1))-methyltransferase TrmK [Pseudogracilibacillus sp.]|nr:tRNA (adenine(22)-N(1))-methyltransferase TrmK [Pseudogracilibacillus sp.]
MDVTLKLSQRLQKIASYISSGVYFADIGSDHGYLPCYVCLHNKEARAIAGEVNEGPMMRTEQSVQTYGLTDRVFVRLGDGLEVIQPNENVKEIVIAGMGGSLISEILENGKDKLIPVNRLILQPNNHAEIVRKLLSRLQYYLTDEIIFEENGHIYEILVADKHANDPYQKEMEREKQYLFGPLLIQEKSSIFIRKWEEERTKIKKVIAQMNLANHVDETKRMLYDKKLRWIEEVLG